MRPKCRECGKKLAENTVHRYQHSLTYEKRGWTKEECQQDANDHAGKPVKIVSYRKHWKQTDTGETKEITAKEAGYLWAEHEDLLVDAIVWEYEDMGYGSYSYGTGRYGYLGEGLFCRPWCGYRWAVSKYQRMYGVGI